MTQKIKSGMRVKLISFHGKTKPPKSVKINDNFWTLIGKEGEVVSEELKLHPAFKNKGARVLIKFDQNLNDFELPNHNEIPNSLWIFISDLKIMDSQPVECHLQL